MKTQFFILKWRQRNPIYGPGRTLFPLITGIVKYVSLKSAETQRDIFKSFFPKNDYWIEPPTSA